MSFDSIFHGVPTSNDGQAVPSGRASSAIDVTSGKIYYKNPQDKNQAGWQEAAGASASIAVTGGSPAIQKLAYKRLSFPALLAAGVTVAASDFGLTTLTDVICGAVCFNNAGLTNAATAVAKYDAGTGKIFFFRTDAIPSTPLGQSELAVYDSDSLAVFVSCIAIGT